MAVKQSTHKPLKTNNWGRGLRRGSTTRVGYCAYCGKAFRGRPWRARKTCSKRCGALAQPVRSLESRMDEYIRKEPGGCWIWTGATDAFGYGRVTLPRPRRPGLAHRAAYELWRGSIPSGLWVLHRCDNPKCVNPSHLFLGTPQDNVRDMTSKSRQARGAQNAAARLTSDDVSLILSSSEAGTVLAAMFGVCASTINRVRRGETWAHLSSAALALVPPAAQGEK